MLRTTSWKNILPARLRLQLARLRMLANQHPRRSAAILITALILQTVVVFLWQPAAPASATDYTRLRAAVPIPPSGGRPGMPSIPFTLGNYREVRALLDTLEYLRSRPVHSRADTLMFLRVLEQYARLDTAFARSLRTPLSPQPHERHPSTPKP
jgi:hypothetical protein